MTQKQSKKEETRQRILEAAGQSFRKHGYAGIGVDALAKAAGVTSGAFYANFGSKDAAFLLALEAGLEEVIAGIPKYQRDYGTDWVKAFADYYLGKAHRGDLACGCAMASLSAEVVRFGADVHALYEAKMSQIADLIVLGLAGGTDEKRRARAWAMLGVLTGGLNVARAMKSKKMSEEVADAIRGAAIKAAGGTRV